MFDMLFNHEGTSKHKYQLAQPLKLPIITKLFPIQISKNHHYSHVYFKGFPLDCGYPGPNLAGFE